MPAVMRCTQRSMAVNRGRPSAGGRITSPVGPADPRVDVVAVVLPVAGDDLVADADLAQPLARLVAVHGSDEQPGRSAVLPAYGLVVDAVGDEHVRAAGLLHGQRLRVGAVVGEETQRALVGVGTGGVEQRRE